MTIDPRQLEVKFIMDNDVPIEIRRNYDTMLAQGKTFGVSKKEHKLWMAQYPMIGENRSMIAGTAFKAPSWSPKHIPFKNSEPVIRRKRK